VGCVVNMKINSEFNQRVVVHSSQTEWLESPMPGVYRRPLDRVGAEVARATTIVKYDPNSKFSPHVHTGGEEFIVLEGVFQDEHGDYPVGSYIRNPPQSSHTPGSDEGCVIFVKLWQFDPLDRHNIRIKADEMSAVQDKNQHSISIVHLYKDNFEDVSIQQWSANSEITIAATDGLEVLVLEGSFCDGDDTLVQHSWLRLPMGESLIANTGHQGARVWVKQNHLRNVDDQIQRLNHAA